MKILRTQELRELDQLTQQREPISSAALMERAATRITDQLLQLATQNTPFVVFAGPGNNGGDALAVARMLFQHGHVVETFLLNPRGELSADCKANRDKLLPLIGPQFHEITTQFTPPQLTERHIVVDGLFGSGLNKPLTGGFAAVVKYINASPARVVAIDVPSGLMGEDNTENLRQGTILRAHITLGLQLPKLAFLLSEAQPYLGEWRLLDIGLSPEAIGELPTPYVLTEEPDVRRLLRQRGKFTHKGDYGRALLIAGQLGMAGASVLAARACLRSGVGLLTVHCPPCNNSIVQTAVPEATTQEDLNDICFTEVPDTDPFQAVGVGPGLGDEKPTENAMLQLIDSCLTPMVVDADGLNLLREHRGYLARLPEGSIITPHPRELERLVGKCESSYERLQKAIDLARSANLHIVLKGAYTAVIAPSGQVSFNPTGNPGMATGGSGDVLTGIITALLAQGYEAGQAARLGAYVHGLAGDLAAAELGQISLTAHDLVDYLPKAWQQLAGNK